MATTKTVKVQARLGEKSTIESTLGNHVVYVDQPKDAGGADKGPTPLQYLFLSLAGCIGSIARIVASQKRLPVRGMEITVEGGLDVEVLLGKSKDNRAGFENLKVTASIDADMTDDEKKAFLHEVDQRCPVSDNLSNTTPVSVELVS